MSEENINDVQLNKAEDIDEAKKYPELEPKPTDRTAMIIGIVVAIVGLLAFIGITIVLYYNPRAAEILRDIVIIYLGVAVVFIMVILLVLTAVVVYLAFKVNDLVKLLDREIRPMLKGLQKSIVELRGTTTFISEHAVQPVIETASFLSATRSVIKSVFHRD
jgi:amino acid transporter